MCRGFESLSRYHKKRPLYEVFFLWILNLGFEPERARAHRKCQSNGVFVANGDVLLMSSQAAASTANVTERTHKIPLSLPNIFYLFKQEKIVLKKQIIIRLINIPMKTETYVIPKK